MRRAYFQLMRQIAGCLLLFVVVQAAEAAAQAGQESPVPQETRSGLSNSAQEANSKISGSDAKTEDAALPDDPGANGGQPGQSGAATSEKSEADSNSGEQQSTPAKPVGTAAAPAANTTGVAGSRPTGAVIAPAKQRRVRTFLIRVGVVVGACVAIGTVAALSHSSPSQPR